MKYFIIIYLITFSLLQVGCGNDQPEDEIIVNEEPILKIPYLRTPPLIDGDLSEWKDLAFSDGVWHMDRIAESSWYDPERNHLTNHDEDVTLFDDLNARYYIAYDEEYIYLGAEVHDNVNDVESENHEAKKWYYKDAIAWFIEAPGDDVSEEFGRGDNAFCFVIDTSYPSYGAWWRHGELKRNYVETPLWDHDVTYKIRFNPWDEGAADYILEVKINMKKTFRKSDPAWQGPEEYAIYRMMIVHCDPDGGNYGGHMLIYGSGDNDITWTKIQLVEPRDPVEKNSNDQNSSKN
ncbi:MAG: hypothetical protein IIA45_00935 [Bacteroidetes bacterium]|nr:hypothetical protein [Bacteroidota bacterium]